MPFFLRSWSDKKTTQSQASVGPSNPKPYKHIPIHAARDARSQMPPGAREADRQAITDHHKRTSQIPQQNIPILRVQQLPALTVDTGGETKNPRISHGDVRYVGKEKPLQLSQRPTAALMELNQLSARQKTRASRRAAHIEPTVEVTYHLGLLPSPLTDTAASDPIANIEKIALPTRKHPPLLANRIRSESRQNQYNGLISDSSTSSASCASSNSSVLSTDKAETATAMKLSGTSYFQEQHVRKTSSATSHEPLNPPPSRSRARDSISHLLTQDARFHNPNSGPRRGQRLRAAPHDMTGIEQAMSIPGSFRPRRAPPAIVRNDSAYPALSMAGFDFGAVAERPYSPDRLRPWLTSNKHNVVQCISNVGVI